MDTFAQLAELGKYTGYDYGDGWLKITCSADAEHTLLCGEELLLDDMTWVAEFTIGLPGEAWTLDWEHRHFVASGPDFATVINDLYEAVHAQRGHACPTHPGRASEPPSFEQIAAAIQAEHPEAKHIVDLRPLVPDDLAETMTEIFSKWHPANMPPEIEAAVHEVFSEMEALVAPYKGYYPVVERQGDAIRGRVALRRDVVTFEGRTPQEVREAFEDAVEDYLELCAEQGRNPEPPSLTE